MSQDTSINLTDHNITPALIREIVQRDPSYALELINRTPEILPQVEPRTRDDLCLSAATDDVDKKSLAQIVLHRGKTGPLRNELSLLCFAVRFLESLKAKAVSAAEDAVITPSDVRLTLSGRSDSFTFDDKVDITLSRVSQHGSIYRPPSWCPASRRWRFQLGFLLRFILAAHPDFASNVRSSSWKEAHAIYRKPENHWYQKIYGLYNSQEAFGDDWLPISEWTEDLLFALLQWPGCNDSELRQACGTLDTASLVIERRIVELKDLQGEANQSLILKWKTPRPDRSRKPRPLRGCIVQLTVPSGMESALGMRPTDICANDPTCSESSFRRAHRDHLSAALAAVERMLVLRETHQNRGGRLDWLILPELSVHPQDVRTHLIPFARTHKAIVLAGLTYEQVVQDPPLVNSALWIVPTWSPAHGLQIRVRRQGKAHLAPAERELRGLGTAIGGFRPCQWLVGYEWSSPGETPPLWLSAAICFDATDLGLATALRDRSDVFAIPALNKDVPTFDNMALALHYHMHQMVIVANNGQFGGSNAYWPRRESWVRQVFHLHGQPQASIALFEIDDIPDYLSRRHSANNEGPHVEGSVNRWKAPPAGINHHG